MRATGPMKPRPSLRAHGLGLLLLTVVAAVASLAVSPKALAQGTRDIAGGPMSTRTFERLLQAFLQPTDEESRVLDRLHERYLDRFRAEIDPELAAFMDRSTNAAIAAAERPGAELQRQLRDVERIATRIAELDTAFFNGALEVLSEPSRVGFARVRAARERQRLLSGMSRFAPLAIGSGTTFVDVVDVVARPRYMDGLAPEARAQLVSFLAAQESRLLAQARVVHGEAVGALAEWYGLSSAIAELQGVLDDGQAAEAKEDAVPATPDANDGAASAPPARGADRARQLVDQMRELGKSMRKAIRANHTDNRSAAGQLADILGKPRADQLRVELALRALVDALRESWYALEVFVGDPDEGHDHRDAVARIRRDPLLTDEQRAAIDTLVASWDADRAPLLERMVEQVDELGRSDMLAAYGNTIGGFDSPDAAASDRLEQEWDGAVSRAEAINARLYAGIAEVLGARAAVYLTREEGSDAPLEEIPDGAVVAAEDPMPWRPKAPESEDDLDAQWSSGSAWASDDTPIPVHILREVLRICGREDAWELAGEIHDSWKLEKWMPRFEELGARLSKAQADCYRVVGEGELILDRAAQARCREVERAMRDARIELEETLFADLAGGLGFDPSGPECTLLRLALADRIEGALSIPRALVLATATTDEVSAILVATPEAWRDAVARLQEALRRQGALMAEESELQDTDWGTVDEATRTRLGQRMAAVAKERMELAAATIRTLAECFDGALAVAITSPERAAEFRRARRQVTHAEIYAPAQSAERVLAAAIALPDLDEETRARLDALQAEYLAVYDTMSERMVVLSTMSADGVNDSIDWADYSKRMQEYERIDFDRKERTEKAIGELRRVLGSERAARIPGLRTDAPRSPGDPVGRSWDAGGLFDDE